MYPHKKVPVRSGSESISKSKPKRIDEFWPEPNPNQNPRYKFVFNSDPDLGTVSKYMYIFLICEKL
jgi:hypothetical protein